MESAETLTSLKMLPVGCRIVVRSKIDWRAAVISRKTDEKVTLSVASPSGRNYRLSRSIDTVLDRSQIIPVLLTGDDEDWRENFSRYDIRW